jgi:hypothetical protein
VVLLTQVDLEEWRRKHTLPAHVNVRSRKTPAPRRASINEHKQLTVGDV